MAKKNILQLCLLFCLINTSIAQEITSMWPYKYADFMAGTVYFQDKTTKNVSLNIHLLKSSLHYLDKDLIRETTTSDILMVTVGFDKYYMRNNQLLNVVAGDSTGFVAELILADLGAAKKNGGAYGAPSSVQSTQQYSSIDAGGVHVTNHVELKNKKDAGVLIPITKKYYIVTPEQVYPASKKAIEKLLPEDSKKEFGVFVKKNKINWKRKESLLLVLNFLNK